MKGKPFANNLLHFARRIVAGTMIAAVAILVAIQFGRVIQANYQMSQRLASVQNDIRTLEGRRDVQLREIQRLRDPQGAIPEIHDKLRLVRPNEAIVFVKTPRPAPSAHP